MILQAGVVHHLHRTIGEIIRQWGETFLPSGHEVPMMPQKKSWRPIYSGIEAKMRRRILPRWLRRFWMPNTSLFYRSRVDFRARGFPAFRIVLDLPMAPAYKLGPALFRSLGADVVAMGVSPDAENQCAAAHCISKDCNGGLLNQS